MREMKRLYEGEVVDPPGCPQLAARDLPIHSPQFAASPPAIYSQRIQNQRKWAMPITTTSSDPVPPSKGQPRTGCRHTSRTWSRRGHCHTSRTHLHLCCVSGACHCLHCISRVPVRAVPHTLKALIPEKAALPSLQHPIPERAAQPAPLAPGPWRATLPKSPAPGPRETPSPYSPPSILAVPYSAPGVSAVPCSPPTVLAIPCSPPGVPAVPGAYT